MVVPDSYFHRIIGDLKTFERVETYEVFESYPTRVISVDILSNDMGRDLSLSLRGVIKLRVFMKKFKNSTSKKPILSKREITM